MGNPAESLYCIFVYRISVVLTCYENLTAVKIFYRVVGTPVTVFEFISVRTVRKGKKLSKEEKRQIRLEAMGDAD